jgi:tetratricopeptide (TPR) repeat protein
MQDEWLYWRAQCRLVLKGYRQAREDLRRLLTVHPDSPRAEAALAARADCDSHLKDDAAAEAAWTRLAGSQGAYAAQALWGLAELRQRQGRRDDALRYFRRLVKAYPASFEAQAAPARMAALAKAPVAKAVTRAVKRRWWVQVGAFSRQAAAVRMVKGLKAHRWAARSTVRVVDGQRLYFVTVGPYGAKAKALAAGRSLHAKEKLDQHLVEE